MPLLLLNRGKLPHSLIFQCQESTFRRASSILPPVRTNIDFRFPFPLNEELVTVFDFEGDGARELGVQVHFLEETGDPDHMIFFLYHISIKININLTMFKINLISTAFFSRFPNQCFSP